jgi:hypothetical protein
MERYDSFADAALPDPLRRMEGTVGLVLTIRGHS